MANVALPSTGIVDAQIRLVRDDNPLGSFTGSEVIVEGQAAIWFMNFQLQPISGQNAREWRAALSRLSRLVNTFEMTPPGHYGNPSGYAGAAPLVAGASQLGRALDCDGVSASTLIALAGAYLSVNGELKILAADANSNASGEVTFDLEPAFRNSPPDDSEVELVNPIGKFRLLTPIAEWQLAGLNEDDDDHAFSIAAREAF